MAFDFDEANVIRGELATGNLIWTPNNFAGFFYDIDDNLGNESLIAKLNGANTCGVEYQTNTQAKEFRFGGWGSYNLIGFLGKRYFAGYIKTLTSLCREYTHYKLCFYISYFFRNFHNSSSLSEVKMINLAKLKEEIDGCHFFIKVSFL
ncbi:MAG: S-layer protein domain-containing protein, partial [Methanothrix sp.]|nr:S-layer protein domain-containing protein [Methanothrix sp.]